MRRSVIDEKRYTQFLLLPTGAVLRALRRSGQDQGPDAITQGMFSIHLIATGNDSFCSFAYIVSEQVEYFLMVSEFRSRIRIF